MSESVSLKRIFEEARSNVDSWPEWKRSAQASVLQEEPERASSLEAPQVQKAAKKAEG